MFPIGRNAITLVMRDLQNSYKTLNKLQNVRERVSIGKGLWNEKSPPSGLNNFVRSLTEPRI